MSGELARNFAKFYRLILKVRYKVRLKGVNNISKDPNRPILILPNHPAQVDPQILFSELYSRNKKAVPIVDEAFYNNPLLNILFRKMNAVSVIDLETQVKDFDLQGVTDEIIDRLKLNLPVVLYPEGRTSSDSTTVLAGRKLAYEVVKNAPKNTQILIVKTSGLWGSIWSRAWTGNMVNFPLVYAKSILITLLNLIFFVPKRKVEIEFLDLTSEIKDKALNSSNRDFNKYLENIYNKNIHNELKYLSHFFYFNERHKKPKVIIGSLTDLQTHNDFSEKDLSEASIKIAMDAIKQIREDLQNKDLKLSDNIFLDLHFDSLDTAEVVKLIESKTNIETNPPLHKIKSVSDLALIANGKFEARTTLPNSDLPNCDISKAKSLLGYTKIPKEYDIARQAVLALSKDANTPFAYDPSFGTLSRKDFLLKAFVLSKYIKKNFKTKNVGIMLPASTAAALSNSRHCLPEKLRL